MKIENTIKIMKEVHKDRIIMVKVGPFYHCYGRDAIVMSYLFDYNLKKVETNYNCGFPTSAINKVMSNLEEKKISYMTVDKADNYEVIDEEDCKNDNKYNEIYSKANKYVNKKNRINEIHNYLMENIGDDDIKEKIMKVEEILYEM